MRVGSVCRRRPGESAPDTGVRRNRSRVALALVAGMLMLLAALLASCGPLGATSTAATPTATVVPTVAAAKGGDSPLPALPAGAAQCAQVPTYQSAQAASAGETFTDVSFPPQSVSVTGGAADNLYHFQVVDVCGQGAGVATLTFYASQMRASGWAASATYPYDGNPTHVCGDSYCWRKADKTVRYVSLEHLSSNDAVTIYNVRLATAPPPSASIAVRSGSGAGRPGQTVTVSASCARGEQMVGGGFNISSGGSYHGYTAASSYPSGPSTWTVTVVGNGPSTFVLQTYVGCVLANYSLDIQIVSFSFQVAAGVAPQAVSAACPSGVATGGGAQLAGGGALLADSAPAQGLSGWNIVATAGSNGVKGTAYALCAARNLNAGPSTSRAFTIYIGTDAQASLDCAAGQWLTSGGYSNADPSADGKNVYQLNGPTADDSRWFLQGHNLDQSSAHGATIWAVCVVPNPQF